MADVLTQQEIDQLLSALDSGELNINEVEDKGERKIRKYDFKRPNKFSKDQIRTLHIIYEYYSRLLSTFFSGMLRTYCQVEVVSVEEQVFYEFANSMTDPILLAVLKLQPMPGNTLFKLSTSVSFSIIERLLGGAGSSPYETRDFTEIELALMHKTLKRIVGFSKDAWSSIIDIEPSIERIETNSRFMQILSPNETVAIVTLLVSIGNVNGSINVCIPHLSIKAIEDHMNSKAWLSSNDYRESDLDFRNEFIKSIRNSKLDVTAVIGDTTISTYEVLELQKGDVIQLDAGITDNIRILIGDILKFRGVPGIYRNKKAVKIIEKCSEEADNE